MSVGTYLIYSGAHQRDSNRPELESSFFNLNKTGSSLNRLMSLRITATAAGGVSGVRAPVGILVFFLLVSRRRGLLDARAIMVPVKDSGSE